MLYALTGDERYGAWVAEGLRRAVAVFRRDDLREGNAHRALYFQPLYDSQVLLLLANACSLIRESPSYSPSLHDEIVAAVFDAAMPYRSPSWRAGPRRT